MTDTKGEDPEEDAGTGEPENHSRHDEALKSETQQCTTDAPVECATPAAKDMSPELHESRSSKPKHQTEDSSLVSTTEGKQESPKSTQPQDHDCKAADSKRVRFSSPVPLDERAQLLSTIPTPPTVTMDVHTPDLDTPPSRTAPPALDRATRRAKQRAGAGLPKPLLPARLVSSDESELPISALPHLFRYTGTKPRDQVT